MDLSQHGVLDLSDAGSFSHLFGVWLPKPVASLDSLPPPLGSVPSQAPGEGLPLPMEISVRASPEFLIHLACNSPPWDCHESAGRHASGRPKEQENRYNGICSGSSVGPVASTRGVRGGAGSGAGALLQAWLAGHRERPYPTRTEKAALAFATRLSLAQISTWFANARRRLKKEEMTKLVAGGEEKVTTAPNLTPLR